MAGKRASSKPDSPRVFGQGAGRRKTPCRAGLYARVSTHDQQTLPLQSHAIFEWGRWQSSSRLRTWPDCYAFSHFAPSTGRYFRAKTSLTSQTPRRLPGIESYVWTCWKNLPSCPYRKFAQYTGGPVGREDAASFTCVAPSD